jgi:hypothetical protein
LEHKGYRVMDMKPAHVIVRPRAESRLLRDRNGQVVYALVDYELLLRTPEHEQAVRSVNRQYYLEHMARRFEARTSKPLPEHLKATNILGIDYIFGHAESTGGFLWVVGKDPDLFNYFLPERWRRTPKVQLSETNQIFQTRTKDNINLVWKVSRVGEIPTAKTRDTAQARTMMFHGFNSPFEEFAHALELSKAGVRAVYPRAIYMTGHTTDGTQIRDDRRHVKMTQTRTPDGDPVLCRNHDYITIWGYWNGPDEYLAARDGRYYRGINALQACRTGLITKQTLAELVQHARQRLAAAGFEDLNLKADHLLLSFDPDNREVRDTFGKPELRLCNFELVRKLPAKAAAKTKRA